VAALAAGRIAVSDDDRVTSLVTAVAGLVVANLLGRWLLRSGVFELTFMRSESTNLVAARSDRPRVWLVAHLDSKSQTIPMLVRVAAVVLSTVMYLMMMLALIAGPKEAAWIAASLTALSLLPLILCFTGNDSRGALDNASGVAAVLIAAAGTPADVGILITSAEELGLAGARAFARSHGSTGLAINCDTIDDRGRFIVMRSGKSARSANALMSASARLKVPVQLRRMIPGILADNVAFAQAGWDSCTLSRGNLATLNTVHTSGDRNTSIDGAAIEQAADILVAAVEEHP
jgi:hypothetical protein